MPRIAAGLFLLGLVAFALPAGAQPPAPQQPDTPANRPAPDTMRGGVITPPDQIDPGISRPTPPTGAFPTPVVPPPTGPNRGPVVPK